MEWLAGCAWGTVAAGAGTTMPGLPGWAFSPGTAAGDASTSIVSAGSATVAVAPPAGDGVDAAGAELVGLMAALAAGKPRDKPG